MYYIFLTIYILYIKDHIIPSYQYSCESTGLLEDDIDELF